MESRRFLQLLGYSRLQNKLSTGYYKQYLLEQYIIVSQTCSDAKFISKMVNRNKDKLPSKKLYLTRLCSFLGNLRSYRRKPAIFAKQFYSLFHTV